MIESLGYQACLSFCLMSLMEEISVLECLWGVRSD
jgi:hypothetical protein